MAQVKGTAVLSSLRYLRARFGEQALAGVLSAMPAEDGALLRGLVLASSWYPMGCLLRLMQEAERQLASQEPRLLQNMGRASCDEGLKGIYKIFLRVGSPGFTIDRAARVLANYYDTGELVVVERGERHVAVELRGLEGSGRQFCERIYGWMQRTLELTGVRNLRSSHSRCVHRGDPVCRFEGSWD
ncbi:MAG TPA: hypothetical protein VMX54_08960 [Vicinamibacteria bacterium]|nr:hypothetical protein [Vicinamibacteria bacterium]